MTTVTDKNSKNVFSNMRPLQRIMLSLFVALLTFLGILNQHLEPILIVSILWVAFALTFVTTSLLLFFKFTVSEIEQKANEEDGSRLFVFISILISSSASMFTVLLLMISDKIDSHKTLTEVVSVMGMVVSWALVHTIFTFHYAHMYYFKQTNTKQDAKPLNFPSETKPDYLDFAYFSFVIGMTFQVSDVQINSRIIRRTVLAHGLLSFAFNTFIVALTINLIAGLKH